MAPPDRLMRIITDSGSSPAPEIGEFAPLAGSAQAERRRDDASPYLSLTRSTALWTLLKTRTAAAAAYTLADLASAILHAARDDARSGELPGRLRRLNVDLPRAIDAIDALVQAGRAGGSIPGLPLVSEVDPYDFGVHTGADGPRGRNRSAFRSSSTA